MSLLEQASRLRADRTLGMVENQLLAGVRGFVAAAEGEQETTELQRRRGGGRR